MLAFQRRLGLRRVAMTVARFALLTRHCTLAVVRAGLGFGAGRGADFETI